MRFHGSQGEKVWQPVGNPKAVTGAAAVRGVFAKPIQMSKKCVWVVFAEGRKKYTKKVGKRLWVLWFLF